MTEQGKKYLSDIIQAVELIKSFTAGINDFEVYVSDLKLKVQLRGSLGLLVRL
jgi:uncharacterized protein with HEPN domain